MPSATDTLCQHYPALSGLGPALHKLPTLAVPTGTVLFDEGAACTGFPLLIDGEVRVCRQAPNGRELELYRVQPGELCLVSSSALFAGQALSARGVSSAPTTLVMLPPDAFRAALADAVFRDFVLGLFAERMADLSALIESVAFARLDSRLATALLGHGPQRHTTHQALADELGTVREMVTRLLKRFERDGLVALSRECISVLDAAGLRAVATRTSPD